MGRGRFSASVPAVPGRIILVGCAALVSATVDLNTDPNTRHCAAGTVAYSAHTSPDNFGTNVYGQFCCNGTVGQNPDGPYGGSASTYYTTDVCRARPDTSPAGAPDNSLPGTNCACSECGTGPAGISCAPWYCPEATPHTFLLGRACCDVPVDPNLPICMTTQVFCPNNPSGVPPLVGPLTGSCLSRSGDMGMPTAAPTTFAPTAAPTAGPTAVPSRSPTASPTRLPTRLPTTTPTRSPTTAVPTRVPTESPTTSAPTNSPTTSEPTGAPTSSPTTSDPTAGPTDSPTTSGPTAAPTTALPTASPTTFPTTPPTAAPTAAPTSSPTALPTVIDRSASDSTDDGVAGLSLKMLIGIAAVGVLAITLICCCCCYVGKGKPPVSTAATIEPGFLSFEMTNQMHHHGPDNSITPPGHGHRPNSYTGPYVPLDPLDPGHAKSSEVLYSTAHPDFGEQPAAAGTLIYDSNPRRSGYAEPADLLPRGGDFQALYSLPQGKGRGQVAADPTYSLPIKVSKGGKGTDYRRNAAAGGGFYSEVDVGPTYDNGPRNRPVSDVTYATVDHDASPGSGNGPLYAAPQMAPSPTGSQEFGYGSAAANDSRMGNAIYGTPTAFPNGGTGEIPFHAVLSSEESTAL